jgi:hypothetical protein
LFDRDWHVELASDPRQQAIGVAYLRGQPPAKYTLLASDKRVAVLQARQADSRLSEPMPVEVGFVSGSIEAHRGCASAQAR